MATIKSYTDLKQSKKLAEILPLESADYCWGINYESKYLDLNRFPYTEPYNEYNNEDFIPCWSLAALLSVLPYPHIEQNYKGKWTCRVELENTTYLWEDSNPIDACVAMIEKLHELNLL